MRVSKCSFSARAVGHLSGPLEGPGRSRIGLPVGAQRAQAGRERLSCPSLAGAEFISLNPARPHAAAARPLPLTVKAGSLCLAAGKRDHGAFRQHRRVFAQSLMAGQEIRPGHDAEIGRDACNAALAERRLPAMMRIGRPSAMKPQAQAQPVGFLLAVGGKEHLQCAWRRK